MKELPILDMQVVHFTIKEPDDNGAIKERPIIILYALTKKGIFEFTNGQWKPVPPITE